MPAVRFKFRTKLMLSLALIILLIFSISSYISYRIYQQLFVSEINKQLEISNMQALARLDFQIADIVRISNYIAFHPGIEKVMMRTSDNTGYSQYMAYEEIDKLLRQVKFDSPQLMAIQIYDMSGGEYFFGNTYMPVNELDVQVRQLIERRLEESNGAQIWMSVRMPRKTDFSPPRTVIVTARWMRSENMERFGSFFMIFDKNLFASPLKDLVGYEGTVYLFDPRQELIYTDDRELEDRFAVPGTAIAYDPHLFTAGTSEIVSFRKSENSHFSLVSRMPLDNLHQRSRVIFSVALYSALIGVALTGLLIAAATSRLLRPISQLFVAMRSLRSGKFDTRINIGTEDELAYIGHAFNAMAENINSLIEEVYKRQLSEREAELTALQAQLNPHFLYNTLDTIYWKLYAKKDMETARLVIALSDMLRYVLEPADTYTTVRDEIRHINHYLSLQKARFGEELEAVVHMDEQVADWPMIRLLLQPIAENAFKHAFRNATKLKFLYIHAYAKDHRLFIELTDNGCGIDEQLIMSLGQRQAHDEAHGHKNRAGLGIRSVIRRIELLYGPPYGLEIMSKTGQGTTVRLQLPGPDSAIANKEGGQSA
jgi:two-component system sensor histidine kinase YesM